MDISKELKDNQTVLTLVKSVSYNHIIADVAKKLSKKKLCYVTLNKTSESLQELFYKKKANMENIKFIDCISKTLRTVKDTKSTTYLSSPGALTEIALTISKHLQEEFDYLIFDSLTNLLVYEKKAPVAKFVSSIVGKIKLNNTRAVFFALDTKEQSALIEQSSMYVDKVIKIKQL